QRGGERLQRRVVQGGGDEPSLVRAGRQVDPAGQHGVEECRVRGGVLGLGGGVVPHVGGGEEDREQVAGGGDPVRYPGGRERVRGEPAHGGRQLVQPAVRRGVGEPQGGQAGGAGQRVTGERARLVDRSLGGQLRHDLGAATERRGGQAAPHHLAEGPQVGRDRVEPVPAAGGDPEAGHHLIEDEQGPVRVGDPGQRGVVAVPRR